MKCRLLKYIKWNQVCFKRGGLQRKRVINTIGILNGCRILDNTIERAEPDSPITARSGAVPLHMGESSSLSPFNRARAALWPVRGYVHESKILCPRV